METKARKERIVCPRNLHFLSKLHLYVATNGESGNKEILFFPFECESDLSMRTSPEKGESYVCM